MSLKRNLFSSYLGQSYTAVIGIVMLPVYVRYLGPEGYGLVGFFVMLQAWGQLLDLGLTPTLSRELSRATAGTVDRRNVALTVRAAEWFFGLLGFVACLVVLIAASWIARRWLKAEQLSTEEMINSVMLMGGVMGLRWLIALYRGALAGLERIMTLNVVGAIFATIRSVGVLGVLVFWTNRPSGFFGFQLFAAVLELIATGVVFYRAFPMQGAEIVPRFGQLRALISLAAPMALLTTLWIVINQTDRFVLSGAVDLQKYGVYTIAVTLAGGITLLVVPMTQALQPRMTVLVAQGEHDRVVQLYRGSTQAITALAFAVSGTMACFAGPILRAWTGNSEVAAGAARVLPMYAVGNAVAAVLSLAFVLQFAHAKLRWHVIGNCVFAVFWFAGAIWAARHSGAVGVGWIWLIGNAAYLIFWLPIVHRWLLPNRWWRWLVFDVGVIVLVEAILLSAIRWIPISNFGRLETLAIVALAAGVVMFVGLLTGGETRRAILNRGTLLATKSV